MPIKLYTDSSGHCGTWNDGIFYLSKYLFEPSASCWRNSREHAFLEGRWTSTTSVDIPNITYTPSWRTGTDLLDSYIARIRRVNQTYSLKYLWPPSEKNPPLKKKLWRIIRRLRTKTHSKQRSNSATRRKLQQSRWTLNQSMWPATKLHSD